MYNLVYTLLITLLVTSSTISKKQETEYYDENQSETKELLPYYWLIVSSLIAMQATILYFMGQPIISRTGKIRLWYGKVYGPENSQHVTDWYTFSHIVHGIFYYWILGAMLPNASTSLHFLLAVVIEIVREILGNTPTAFHLYRKIDIFHTGDTILNSISDTFAMSFGFYLSSLFPAWVMLNFAILIELLCAYSIRENILINIIQRIYFAAIAWWQAAPRIR